MIAVWSTGNLLSDRKSTARCAPGYVGYDPTTGRSDRAGRFLGHGRAPSLSPSLAPDRTPRKRTRAQSCAGPACVTTS